MTGGVLRSPSVAVIHKGTSATTTTGQQKVNPASQQRATCITTEVISPTIPGCRDDVDILNVTIRIEHISEVLASDVGVHIAHPESGDAAVGRWDELHALQQITICNS